MGAQQSVKKISYEDMQHIIKNPTNSLIISTLDSGSQNCLIRNTVKLESEVNIINRHMQQLNTTIIIIYGRNCNDESIYKKYSQLLGLGFTRVYIYTGGLFEWLCLQDIYGCELFPTTSKELDILKYKPASLFSSVGLLTDIH